MPNRFKTAALVEKELAALQKANEMAEGARREAARKRALLPIKLKAFEADQKEAEAQKTAGQGEQAVVQPPSLPAPANVSPDQPIGGMQRDNRIALQDILSGSQTSTGSTEVRGFSQETQPASEGGLPSRTLERTTTNESTENLLGRPGDVLRLLFGADTATIPRTSTSTTAVENPDFKQHLNNVTAGISDAAFRTATGDLRPNQLGPEMENLTKGLTPAERQMVMTQSRTITSGLLQKDKEQKFNQGRTLVKEAVENGWKMNAENSQVLFDFVNGKTPEEVGKAAEKMFKISENTPDRRASKLREQVARLQLEEAEANKARLDAQAEVDGLLGAAGLRPGMTEDQIFDNWKGIAVHEGVSSMDASTRGLAVKLQLEEISRDGNVTLIKDNWVGADDLRSHRNRDIISDFMVFGQGTIDGRGFTKDGSIALSNDEVDREETLRQRKAAASRLGKLGMLTAIDEETGELAIGFQEDSANTEVFSRLYLFANLTREKEIKTGTTILNPYEWQPIRGVGGAPDALKTRIGKQPTTLEPNPAKARAVGRQAASFAAGGAQAILHDLRLGAKALKRATKPAGEFTGGFAEQLRKDLEE